MKIFNREIRLPFAAPATIEQKVLPAEEAWSESSMYRGADFPKYNPDSLVGRKSYAIYGKMMVDEQIKAVVHFKRDAITSRDWIFEFRDSELSEDEQEFRKQVFRKALDEMEEPFSDALNGIMSAMYMGFSISEKLLHHIDIEGKTYYGVKRIKLRPCDSFLFHTDEFGNVMKFVQQFDGKEQELDPTKFIHFVQNPDVDEHYGRSELREAYRAYFSKDMVIKFQNIWLERFASGFVWAAPTNGKTLIAGTPEYIALQNVMKNLQATSSIILPSNIELNIEHPATTDAFERAISQHDKAIAKALLVPNLMGISEQGSTGSYAQSQTQLEAFLWTLDADAGRLEQKLNAHLFKELGDLNFGDGKYPKFKFKPVSDVRKLEIVKIWQQLVTGGAVQATDADEAHLRDALEMPKKPKIEGDAPDLILNGAQVTSLVGIINSVGAGQLSPGAAKALIMAVFPINEDQASAMVDSAKVEKPEPVPYVPNVPPEKSGTTSELAPNVPPQAEETIVGKMGISVSAFSRAMKRVDFAVIGNKADNSSRDSAHELAVINSDAVARLVSLAEELKLGTAEGDPNDIQKIVFTAGELSALKKAAATGLNDAWKIGESHGKKELAKAKGGSDFATNDLALQDVAASYMKQKAYTLAGDISAATQKTIRNTLMEGVKVSKTFADTKRAIYKALEADGLLTEEAVMDALGTTTVKATNARIETAMRTTSFEAINEARYQFFSDPELGGFVEALEYSAILDDRTTEICSQLNGETYGIDSEVWSTFRPPNHFNAVASGTLIETNSGRKRIEDISIGDFVLTHKGNWKRVYSVMAKMPDSSSAKMITLDTGRMVCVTDEHPILTEAGWNAVRDLKIGDVLFQYIEDMAGFESCRIGHPENHPSMFDKEGVAFEVGFCSDARGMSFTVNLENDHVFDEREIGHVAFDRILTFKRYAAQAQSFEHDGFMPSQRVAPSNGLAESGLFGDSCFAHRIAGTHSFGMSTMDSACFLSQSESPMISPSGLGSGVGIGNSSLINSASDGNAMPFAPSGKNSLTNSETSFDGTNRFLVPKMAFGNEVKDGDFVAKVDHKDSGNWIAAAIISIADIEYNYPVWNIGVEDDESYHANGIVVHNCRSILIPVTQRDTWTESEPPTVDPQKGFGFARCCNHT